MFKYHHEYNKSLVYKIFCANKPSSVITDLNQALEIIKKVNKMSGGIKQIVYLIGWQYDGHDSKWPAFFEVNNRLKRSEDLSARDSLNWLMDEALKYNTIVSLHIDMCIAFENSPLWDTYVENDLLVKNLDGSLLTAGVWGGEQSYSVSKTLEWQKGFSKKRIDRLLDLLPVLKRAGTIHIDVFMPIPSPYHNISRDDEIDAMKSILSYWNFNGIDVTTEWLHFELVGLVPMAWHYNLSEGSRLEFPSSIVCGGGPLWNARNSGPRSDGMGCHYFTRPEEGCLYEEAWGYSMDDDFKPGFEEYFKKSFYISTLPWCYLNTKAIIRHIHTDCDYTVEFDNNTTTNVKKQNRHFTLKTDDKILIDGTDVFMPATWTDGDWIMYSLDGGKKTWLVPEQWKDCSKLKFKELTAYPENNDFLVECQNGHINVELKPLQAFMVSRI